MAQRLYAQAMDLERIRGLRKSGLRQGRHKLMMRCFMRRVAIRIVGARMVVSRGRKRSSILGRSLLSSVV